MKIAYISKLRHVVATARQAGPSLFRNITTISCVSRERFKMEKTLQRVSGSHMREKCLVDVRGQRSGWLETTERHQ